MKNIEYESQKQQVIKLCKELNISSPSPENLKLIRAKTGLGLFAIKQIIMEQNNSTKPIFSVIGSEQHPSDMLVLDENNNIVRELCYPDDNLIDTFIHNAVLIKEAPSMFNHFVKLIELWEATSQVLPLFKQEQAYKDALSLVNKLRPWIIKYNNHIGK